MKKYVYYQPNKKDLKDRQGDCTIRAMTKFFKMTWVEAFDALVGYARENQTLINSLSNIKLYMEKLQIPYTTVYKPKARKKMTVEDFAKQYKDGVYMLYIRVGYGTHLVTVENGQYFDTWDCGDRYVYGYWH